MKIDDASFENHKYEEELVNRVKILFQLNQKSAINALNKLEKYPDLFEEFKRGCSLETFAFPLEGIKVLDYDARMLYSQYPLSPLGAYNYLIYLQEKPKEALEDLKNGLPRK